MNAALTYQEFPATPALMRHVQCVWRLRARPSDGAPRTIYPDGHCELIVHLGAPPRCWHVVDGWHTQARTLFAAQRISAVRLASRQPLDCLGVRLRPAASTLLAPGIRDRIVDLAAVDADLSRRLAQAARAFVRGRRTPLWNLLEARCAAHALDERMEGAVTRICATAGRARIDTLARAACMSMRGFQQRFSAAVGLPPKQFARLSRLQSVLRALDTQDGNLAAVAADTGFADQAHATRELRRIIGVTPAKLRAALRRPASDDAIRLAVAFVRGSAR